MSFDFDAQTKAAILKHDPCGGEQWLLEQASLVDSFLVERDLTFTGFAPKGLAINQICFLERGDRSFVLKTGLPEPELFTEMRTLQIWRGRSNRVQLLDCDENNGILLLERIQPGHTFREQPVINRSSVIPELFAEIPVKVDTDLPRYEQWLQRAFDHQNDEFLSGPIELAESLYAGLRLDAADEFLLHGDLHHENMLLDDNGGWIAIDPKGVMGARLLEYGRFMHNFIADEARPVAEVVTERAETLAGEFSANEIIKVGFIDLVLGCTWVVNSGEELGPERQQLIQTYAALVS